MTERQIHGTVVVMQFHGVENHLSAIRDCARGAEVVLCPSRSQLSELIAQAEVVAGNVPRDVFDRARRLRWIHTWSAGLNGALYPALIESDVIVTGSSGNAAPAIAEHCLLLMLMLQQQSPHVLQNQKEHVWKQFAHPELYGKTMALIGLGDIGLDIARRARAFHMRVLGMRRRPIPCPDVDEIYPRERLHEMLAAADFVVMAAPMTPETDKMLGESEFRAMRQTAYFINVSRGGCVDESVLIRALREGWIAGAGIDQPTQKPLSADSELWDLPNTILTPAYGGHTLETYERGVQIFLDNLTGYTQGTPLLNVIDKRAGY